MIKIFYTIAGLMADTLLCWRLYVIRATRAFLFVPIILLTIESSALIYVCVLTFSGYTYDGSHYQEYTVCMMTAAACMAVADVWCSTLIIHRLWTVGGHGRTLYRSVIVSIIESGSLLTVTMIIVMVVFLLPHSYGTMAFVVLAHTMIVPIAPMLIVRHLTSDNYCSVLTNGFSDHSRRTADGVGVVSTTIRFGPISPSHDHKHASVEHVATLPHTPGDASSGLDVEMTWDGRDRKKSREIHVLEEEP